MVNELTDYLRGAQRILVFTGAGISTGSGIPDFRGPGGVWTRRKPVYFDNFMSSEAARIEHWDYKLEGWNEFRNARPNAAHLAITRLQEAGKLLLLVTQNIDGLHLLGGIKPEKLVELHGTNLFVECVRCGARSDPEPHFEYFRRHRKPPLCACGGFLKQATISFGQSLNPKELHRAEQGALECDLVVALGSTLSVYPAAAFPLLAADRGAPYIIINRGPTDHDGDARVSLRIEGDVVDIFPAAVDAALS
jgi:NAD-dependent deacetylase